MSNPKVDKAQRSLQSIQVFCDRALDAYQKPRDKEAIKKFFPDLDVALGQISDVLSSWPEYEGLSDSDKMSYGSFLSQHVEAGFRKIISKV